MSELVYHETSVALRIGVARHGSLAKIPVDWLVSARVPRTLAEKISVMLALAPNKSLKELMDDLRDLGRA